MKQNLFAWPVTCILPTKQTALTCLKSHAVWLLVCRRHPRGALYFDISTGYFLLEMK